MEVNEQNLEALATYLRKTLSINGEERGEGWSLNSIKREKIIDKMFVRLSAEKALKQIERNENYSKLLLTLCERANVPDAIRRAAVITFKNLVKKNWPTLDATSATTNPISLNDRNYIKQQIVDLMIRSPEHIQQQLSESITVIGRHDFPDQWPSLLDRMVQYFQQPSTTENSFQSIFGILATAHSLFERYRHEHKSDDLWLEIKLVLERFAPAFTQLFQVRKFNDRLLKSTRCLLYRLVVGQLLSTERNRFQRNEKHSERSSFDDQNILRSQCSSSTFLFAISRSKTNDFSSPRNYLNTSKTTWNSTWPISLVFSPTSPKFRFGNGRFRWSFFSIEFSLFKRVIRLWFRRSTWQFSIK